MKVKPEILQVLCTLAYSGDGKEVRIVAQLDRKLYVRVNEVLEACGGEWNRKAKAHLFPGDAEALIETVINTGTITTKKDNGFFPTPKPLARQLVERLDVEGHDCLEPSAGLGSLADCLVAARANSVTTIERDTVMRGALRDRGYKVLDVADFLDVDVRFVSGFGRVAMNPPFYKVGAGDHIDHVLRAWALLGQHGRLFSILPSSVMWRTDKRHRMFRTWVDDRGGLFEPLPDNSFRESGTGVNTCVLFLDRKPEAV